MSSFKQDLLTAELVRELLDYNPDTGVLTWRRRALHWFATDRAYAIWNTRFAGAPAGGAKNATGYKEVRIFYRCFLAHRVMWLWMTGEWPPGEIDHIDHDRANNAWLNLRAVSTAENLKNASRRRDNTSGVTGVCWHANVGKWMVRVGRTYIGVYASFDEAVAARLAEQDARGFHANHGVSQ